MKVLIAINDMLSGGAQKSLISFLKALELSGKLDMYKIDLLVADKKGIFLSEIPQDVNVLKAPKYFKWMNCELKDISFWGDFSCLGIMGKVCTILKSKIKASKSSTRSEFWYTWRNFIPKNRIQYDVAIAYMDGWPNYYISEKVSAKKKVLWVHNEYQKLGYDRKQDEKCYRGCDRVITISEKCKASFIEAFPELENKIEILENITLASDIKEKAMGQLPEEFAGTENKIKILSIGRLTEQKAFDLAIASAAKLDENGQDFIWLILGEGPDREMLEKLVKDNHLEGKVLLPGVRSNPYIYMKYCDVFVQSSKYEGKSIVLDEAKVLACPIVVTDYKTVHDAIANEKTGLIVPMEAEEIAEAIVRITTDENLRDSILNELKKSENGNEEELYKYFQLMYM